MASRLSLARWAPALYRRQDATGDWGRLLAVIERVLNDILGSTDTRATLDGATLGTGQFDTVLEDSTEGEAGTSVALLMDSLALYLEPSRAARSLVIHAVPGATQIADIETRIGALAETDAVVRVKTPSIHGGRVLGSLDGFPLTLLRGASPSGRLLGKVSVDAMADLRDPLAAEARLLPYLAQGFGWELDQSLPERLQRKCLSLAEALFREKGTRPGIVDALRLLLGLDVVYRERWADGWKLGRSLLSDDTILAPGATAPGYSEGELTMLDPGSLNELDTISGPGWGPFQIQKSTGRAAGDGAVGWLDCREPGALQNGMTLEIQVPSTFGGTVVFEFKRSPSWVVDPGHVAIDVSSIGPDGGMLLSFALAAAMNGPSGLGGNYLASTNGSPIVKVVATAVGPTSNAPFAGSAAEVLRATGVSGGLVAGAFANALEPLNIGGCLTSSDVAVRLAAQISYGAGSAGDGVLAQAALAKVYLRGSHKGPQHDGPFSGTLVGGSPDTTHGALAVDWPQMRGGVGLGPAVLTFQIVFPRHLTDDELRTAIQVVDAMKRAETHFSYLNPPAAASSGPFVIGRNRLGSAARITRHSQVKLRGGYAADPFRAVLGESFPLALGVGVSVRTQALIIGASYRLMAEWDVYVRQGNRTLVTTSADMLLPSNTTFDFTVTSERDRYVAGLAAGGATTLRVSRLDG